ncbi:MAG: GNAT family N-acetyltransferase [Paracoccaceae bacterium]
MSVDMEPAQAGDAAAIAAILSGWIDEVDWMPRLHAPSQYLGYGALLMASTAVTVAREKGQIVGFLGRQDADIQALYVARGARDRSIGAGLLQIAKSEATVLELWVFQANTGARRFYARHGFAEDQLTDGQGNDEKVPDVHLSWSRDSR